MASQHGSGFISPIFNQNFAANSFNVNPGMDRPPRPQFQVPHNPPSGSFQSPERFVHGFQNRPQFSNFPGDCSFLSRPPPLPPSSTVRPPPLPTSNTFPNLPNSAPRPSFPSQSSATSHPSFSARPPVPPHLPRHSPVPSHPPPPLPQPTFSSQQSFSPHQPPLHNQLPSMSHPPQHNQLPNMSHPPQRNQLPNMPHPPQHNQIPNMTHPPQHNRLPNLPHPLQHSQLPNVSRPPQLNKPPNISRPPQQNQFPPLSQSPHQHHGFRMNSPNLSSPPTARPQFDRSFQHPYRPWNKTPRFSGPRTPFTNRSPNVVKPHQFKDTSQQVNKNKKQKSREFRKLKSWMTDELFAEVKKKNALYLKAKSSDEQTAWQEFRLQRNRVSSLIKEAKIKAGLITRKVKEDDSTEKPFSCDTCDRAFATENELHDHISQHIKCDYENCTFEAHPKIVLLHKKMQHETGYAESISKLKNDAEIKKWREERRKRFPTAENIRKRKAEEAEKIARGEVLETKEFGKFKRRREENTDLAHSRRKRMRGRSRRNYPRRHNREQYPDFKQIKANSESDSDSDSHISLNMFSGLSSLANSAEEICQPDGITEINSSEQNLPNIDKNHSDVSHSENNTVDSKTKSPITLNAEKSIDNNLEEQSLSISFTNQNIRKSKDNVNNVDESVLEIPEDEIEKPKKELISVEDSDDEGPEVLTIAKCQEEIAAVDNSDNEGPKVLAIAKCQEKISAVDKKEESRPDDNIPVKVFDMDQEKASNGNDKNKSDVNGENKVSGINHENGNQSRRNKTRRDCNFTAPKQVRKSTLLEKLLADDIRHERNVILQCIRHIVNNNFFGLAVKKS